MAHRTTHTNLGKIYSTLTTWLTARMSALTGRAFAAPNARAHRHGWQITITQGGLGRAYRDPRFGLLADCAACYGTGTLGPVGPCGVCHGTGRVRKPTA